METIILRNTISKVATPFPADYARRLLADPFLGKHLIEVDTEKPEVLGQPETAEEHKAKRSDKNEES